MLEYRNHITREMLRSNPKTLFVFGDNLLRKGLGGQAKEMRGEPNAVGIATKRWPSRHRKAFFTDADFESWKIFSEESFILLRIQASQGKTIIWPSQGIGTGLAMLKRCAPSIWTEIEKLKKQLEFKKPTS